MCKTILINPKPLVPKILFIEHLRHHYREWDGESYGRRDCSTCGVQIHFCYKDVAPKRVDAGSDERADGGSQRLVKSNHEFTQIFC